jgi:hypothetical protein
MTLLEVHCGIIVKKSSARMPKMKITAKREERLFFIIGKLGWALNIFLD